jgi:hypothetical protein
MFSKNLKKFTGEEKQKRVNGSKCKCTTLIVEAPSRKLKGFER